MKRIIKALPVLGLIAVLTFTLVAAVACTEAIGVTDERGVNIEFDDPVDTIVSLAPSNTELVFFVGAGDKLIGRTDYCNYPEEASSVESIGGFYDPNKEAVVVLNPDVVLATDMHVDNGDVEWLEDQGLKVIVMTPQTVGEVMDCIMLVGKITGNEGTASRKVKELEERVDAITEETSALTEEEKPRVLHVTWHDPLWTVGANNVMNTVIEMAGGVNIFTDVSGDVQVDVEQAVVRNPEVITVSTGHGSNMTDSYDYIVAADSLFKETDAHKNDNIHLIDADLVSRAGPRIVDALELVAGFIHPEIFP